MEKESNNVVLIAPNNCETWRNRCKPIKKVFYKLIKIISKYKDVILICNNIEENKKYQNLKKVKLCEIKSNDSWARDTLPLKVNNKYIGFVFNGYNGVLQEYDLDAELGKNFCDKFNLPFKKCDLVFEGGELPLMVK